MKNKILFALVFVSVCVNGLDAKKSRLKLRMPDTDQPQLRALHERFEEQVEVHNKAGRAFDVVCIYQERKRDRRGDMHTTYEAIIRPMQPDGTGFGIKWINQRRDGDMRFLREIRVYDVKKRFADNFHEHFIPDRWVTLGPYETLEALEKNNDLDRGLVIQTETNKETFDITAFKKELKQATDRDKYYKSLYIIKKKDGLYSIEEEKKEKNKK